MKLPWGSAGHTLWTDEGNCLSTERAFSVVFFCFQTIHKHRYGSEAIAGPAVLNKFIDLIFLGTVALPF